MLFRVCILALVSIFGLVPFCNAQGLPRTGSGKPDLHGIWLTNSRAAYNLEGHVARTDLLAGLSVVEGGEIPYLPQARVVQQQNFASRLTSDPLRNCFFPGVPRIMAMDFPFQITQTDEHVAITFEWTQVYRLLYTTGEPSLYEGIDSWMGHSRGRWDGDVLVVDVKDFNDKTWLDASGNFHSAAMSLTERYELLDANTIRYEVTVTDPQVFSRPWVMRYELKRQTDFERLLEYQCQAEKEELSGDFERDSKTWYPAAIPAVNAPFDADAGLDLPLPEVTGTIRRLPDGKPDMGGYFMADAGGANYGLETTTGGFLTPRARGVVVDPADGSLPYQVWARAEKDDRILPQRGYDDPTAHCFVAGIPRSHYVPSPFHIIQTKDNIVVLHERMAWREISLTRTEHLPANIRLWQGDSLGHWEGDTLVVDSANFNGKTWLNEAGDVTSHMQQVHETFTPVAEDLVIYRATISDPIAYSRPWTIEIPLIRSADELLEVACLEDNNDLQHLRDVRDEYRAALAEQQ